jgi:EmrB/QacA subfamily drug resistance transporter
VDDAIHKYLTADSKPVGERRRWIALAVLCLGQLMIVLDVTIVVVALPAIQRELHFSHASLAWVINAYLITFAGLLLFAGRLGDLLGRKRVFIAGLVVFTAASALCGASQSEAMLIIARLLQGVGGALTGAVIVAIISSSFPAPRQQAHALGAFAFTGAAGGSLGLLLSGILTQELSWHWIFLVNVPIGIVVIPLAIILIEPHRGLGVVGGVDALGAILITAALMVGSYAIVEASTHGWTSAVTLGGGGVALALFVLFIARESATPHPLIPLRIFRSRNVATANITRGVQQLGMYGSFFLVSLYLQNRLHLSALDTGLAFLPQPLLIGTISMTITPRLLNRIGAKRTLLPGLVIIATGLALLARLPLHGSYLSDVLPGLALIGLGGSLSFLPLVSLSMRDVPPADFGAASGMINVSQQIGGAIGLAVLATLTATRARELVASGHSATSAAIGGDHLAFVVSAVAVGAPSCSAWSCCVSAPPVPRQHATRPHRQNQRQTTRLSRSSWKFGDGGPG